MSQPEQEIAVEVEEKLAWEPYAVALKAAHEAEQLKAYDRPEEHRYGLLATTWRSTRDFYRAAKDSPVPGLCTVLTLTETVSDKVLTTVGAPPLGAIDEKFIEPGAQFLDNRYVDDAVVVSKKTVEEAVHKVKTTVGYGVDDKKDETDESE